MDSQPIFSSTKASVQSCLQAVGPSCSHAVSSSLDDVGSGNIGSIGSRSVLEHRRQLDQKAVDPQVALLDKKSVKHSIKQGSTQSSDYSSGNWKFFGTAVNQDLKVDDVVEKIESGQLWVVNSRRRNGLIVVREFHAEFAGPGAAVGGDLDKDIVEVIPIGNLSLLEPDSHEAHQNAIKIRLQWIRLTQNFTDQPSPDDRARMILEQFKTYFDQATVDLVPDRAFAMLVGVLPQTIRRVRSTFVWQ